MNQASFIILSLSLLPGAVLFSSNDYAASAIETQATVGQDPSTPSPLFIHYENGLIHAHIDNVPLGNVLRELETRTRARFTLSDLAIANRPVSAVVEAMPFEQGVKEILAGYSYAIYRVGGVPKILVLSTPVVQRTAGEEPTDLVETIQSQLTFNQCVPGTGKSVTCPSVDKHEAVRLEITGPSTSVTSTPNPFGIVVDMTFTSPTSKTYKIPVVYAADGNEGSSGNVWFAYFSPNESGTWNVSSTSSNTSLNGWTGSFSVTTTVPFSSPDLRQKGWLRSEVGKFYPKFDNGTYFVKGGSDDPEAFLGYPGCTDYQANPTSAVAAACPALGVGTSTSRTSAVNQRKSQIDT